MPKVLIYSDDRSEIVGECSGPDWMGKCPRSHADAAVACAGRRIVLADEAGRHSLILSVEPKAESCPLAALNLFGHDFVRGNLVWKMRRK